MFLILPTEQGEEAFEGLEAKLPSLNFEQIFDAMEVVFGDVLLPRMEIEFSANLGPHLAQIGHLKVNHPALYLFFFVFRNQENVLWKSIRRFFPNN